MTTVRTRTPYLLQIPGSLFILGLPVSNALKLALFAAFWLLTFKRLMPRELVLAGGIALGWSLMDLFAIRSGKFEFVSPDAFGLALYAPACYAFFPIHVIRLIGGTPPRCAWKSWVLLGLFLIPFMLPLNDLAILMWTAVILLIGLAVYRDREDWLYTGYLIFLGGLWEYIGVWTHQWTYPAGHIPAWSITMWGGIGFFIRRLAYPCLFPPTSLTSVSDT
jgi:hypothetical protein